MSAPRDPFRVLYVINDLAVGGAQRALLSQAGALDRARFEPRIASLELVPGAPLAAMARSMGVEVDVLRAPAEPRAHAVARLRALLDRFVPDVVHTHLAAAGVAGRLAARLAGVPVVVSTQHNLTDWQERAHHPLRALERSTLPMADRIVTVSDAVRDAVVARVPRLAERVVTIRNGIELDAFRDIAAQRPAVRAELGLPAHAFVVGTVARLERTKGVDALLEAVARIASFDLYVVVVGDGAERPVLEAQAEAAGLGTHARFVGARDDVPRLLAAMDVFAAPSRTEGLGIAAIEALAAGVPVIASNVGGLVEVVTDGTTGRLLPPDDPTAWAAGIQALSADAAARERMARAAVKAARRFAIGATARELGGLYAEALGARRMRRAA